MYVGLRLATFVATPEPTGSGICSNDESRPCSVDEDCECSPPFRRVLRGTNIQQSHPKSALASHNLIHPLPISMCKCK